MTTDTYTLVTGASSGIGKELANIAAKDGHNVVLVARARSKSALTKLARDLTKRHDVFAEVVACDMSQPSGIESLCRTLKQKRIVVDVLINNAGFGDYSDFAKSDLATQLNMIDLNIRALSELTHRLLPGLLKQKRAYIMNLGSVASFLPGPRMSVYFASKAFVLSFSEALSEELRGTGVSVTCLCPGSTKTSFGENAHVSATHSTRTSNVSARDVAEFGWKAMQVGKPVAIHRLSNRSAVFFIKFLPRQWVRRLVHHIQH